MKKDINFGDRQVISMIYTNIDRHFNASVQYLCPYCNHLMSFKITPRYGPVEWRARCPICLNVDYTRVYELNIN